MKTITVTKSLLNAKLRENRAKHTREYLAAVIGWQEKVLAALADAAEEFARDEITNNLNVGYRFTRPENHTDEYDRAVEMLEWETSDAIILTEDDFRHFVQDDWDWTHQHRLSSSQYSAS